MYESFELRGARFGSGGWLSRQVQHGLDTLLTWQTRAQQRRELMALNAHRLRDIGISRDEAAAEAAKPFWRA